MKKLLLATLVFSSIAYGNEECSKIKKDTDRLACYDGIYLKKNKKPKKAVESKPKIDLKHWRVSKRESKIDDSKTVVIMTDSPDRVEGRFETTTPTMIIRCSNNKTDMYFDWGQGLGVHVYGIKAKVRLGKSKARTYTFDVSTSFDSAFVRKPIGFLKKAFSHDTMIVHMETAYTAASSVSFNIKGLKEVIKPLRRSCNW